MDFFYPNYLNDMWRIVGLVFFGDKDAFVDAPAKRFRHQALVDWLNGQGLAFYDTACRVRRLQGNASDKFLEIITPTDIEALVDRLPLCTAIAATGQKSAETLAAHYGIKPPAVGQSVDINVAGRRIRFYRMPSTSRAYPAPLAQKPPPTKPCGVPKACSKPHIPRNVTKNIRNQGKNKANIRQNK